MDPVKAGQVIRALRRAQKLRQIDVAGRAGLGQQTISDVECGRFAYLSIDSYCRLAAVLGATIDIVPRWRGPNLVRLLDRRHAALAQAVACHLERLGWDVHTEFTFNHYGDRGSVDILAWHPVRHALLIVEIKTELVSVEETIRTLDMKSRVVPMLAGRDLGWTAERDGAVPRVGIVLVLPEGSTQRDLVARHATLMAGSLPARNVALKQWLRRPTSAVRGTLFFRDTGRPGAAAASEPGRRVRVRATEGHKATDGISASK
jgi:transcriptional regulator with XRE-family HTH domain